MARLQRLTLPGIVHHVLHRGNNHQPIASSAADFDCLLKIIGDESRIFRVALHAYVLLPDQFHLVATPASSDAFPRFMQAVGRRYVRYFNDVRLRTGTLWEGRYRSTLLDAPTCLLPTMVYLDALPVRAGLADEEGRYAWSSRAHYIGALANPLLESHPSLWSLGNTPFAREAAYARLVQAGPTPLQEAAITAAVLGGWPLGGPQFIAELQEKTTRRVERGVAGRPKLVNSVPK